LDIQIRQGAIELSFIVILFKKGVDGWETYDDIMENKMVVLSEEKK
jgi:hypothetical protein